MKIRFQFDEKEKRGSKSTLISLVIIIFLATVFIANAAQWMWIQQISKDDAGTIPVDANSNGAIDYAQSSSHSSTATFADNGYLSFINGTIISPAEDYDVIWEDAGSNNMALCTYESVLAAYDYSLPVPKNAYCAYFYYGGL
jgi:hypothetical protein